VAKRVRRRHRRFEVFEPASGSAGTLSDTVLVARNMSRSGMYLESSAYAARCLSPGDDVELYLRDGNIRLGARVVHVRTRGIGVRITSGDPQSFERYRSLLDDYAASNLATRSRARATRDITVPIGEPKHEAASR
jgi:hypothetical protein